MNFIGIFGPNLPNQLPISHSGVRPEVEGLARKTSDNAITIADALLFSGEYRRARVDLVLSKDGRELIGSDYFKSEKRSDLGSPNGARLTDGLVNELTRQAPHTQVADAHVVGKVIDHLTKLTASSVPKCVPIILNVGDYVNKSDVVLNGLVYGSNQPSNPTLPSLIQGIITFLPDETAKSGDLKIDAPVASSGVFH